MRIARLLYLLGPCVSFLWSLAAGAQQLTPLETYVYSQPPAPQPYGTGLLIPAIPSPSPSSLLTIPASNFLTATSVPASLFLGGSGGGFVPLDQTSATAALAPCTGTLKGLVPTPPNDASKFLDGQCQWVSMAAPTAYSADGVTLRLSGTTFSAVPVPTNAALKALSTAGATSGQTAVHRSGFYSAGDGGAADYVYSSTACPISSGAGNDGSQVQAAGSGCWLAGFSSSKVDPRAFGARCGGSVDATATINAIIAAFPAGVEIAAPACTFLVAGTLNITSDIHLHGIGLIYPGAFTKPVFTQPSSSTVFNITSTSLVPINVTGVGDEIDHISFNYPNQVTPPDSGTYNPTIYPWTIQAINNPWAALHLHDISFNGGTNCIDLEAFHDYPPTQPISSVESAIERVYLNPCMNKGIRLAYFDAGVIRLNDIRYDLWWGNGSGPLGDYVRANTVDMNFCYVANAQISNIEYVYAGIPLYLEPCTVTGGFGHTAATDQLQMTNISFNETCRGIVLSAPNIETTGQMTNIVAYADQFTSCPIANPVFFDFNSNKARWTLNNIKGGSVQTLAQLGPGANVAFNGVDLDAYSAFAPGAPAFKVSSGALFSRSGPMLWIRPGTGAGPLVGPGPDATTGCENGIQVGGNSGASGTAREGAFTMVGSCDQTHSGFGESYYPNGSRAGYFGHGAQAASSLEVGSDAGPIQLLPRGNPTGLSVDVVSGKLIINANGLPTSCSGQATGTLWDNANVIQACP